MADQQSIDFIESTEKELDHLLNLLTEADQALEQCLKSINDWSTAHNLNPPKAQPLEDALKSIQGVISGYTARRNEFAGQLREAKEEAAQRSDDPGY